MAILKHFNVKNSDYSAALRYFVFEHDERSKPLKDEQGNFILRECYLIDGINCCPMSYDVECRTSNRQWKKNLHPDDIKQHHFILSFEPSDIERGLTLERAQELGMEFARKHFAGHQCLVATHADGHNNSRNIHCHIALNSLRIKDLPEQPAYSEYERDRKAGYKLHPTKEMMQYLKADLMRLCREHGLHQVELNKPARKHITDKEYRAKQRGQEKLDKANEQIKANGGIPTQTKFQTELERMREAIDSARQRAESVEDFKRILSEKYSIIVKESRGRWSYLPTGRQKPITWRRLGTDYQKEFIEQFITAKQRQNDIVNLVQHQTYQQSNLAPANVEHHTAVITGRLIDLNDPKIQASYGLTQWAKIQNLKEMSRMFNVLTENGLLSEEKLSAEIAFQKQLLSDGQAELKNVEARLKEINQLRRLLAQYYGTRDVYNQYRRNGKSNSFREQHVSEITLYEGARKQLNDWQKAHNNIKIPSDSQLKQEKAVLTKRKDSLYQERSELRSSIKVLEESYELFAIESQKKQIKHLEQDRN